MMLNSVTSYPDRRSVRRNVACLKCDHRLTEQDM